MRKIAATALVLSLLLMSACSSQKNSTTEKNGDNSLKISTEPVNLTMAVVSTAIGDQDFQKYFVEETQKKYPNITLVKSGTSIDEMISAGTPPDIVYSSFPGIRKLQDLQIIQDLNPYIKKFGTDLSRFDPVLIDALKNFFSNKGEMTGLPFKMNIPALLYNKDLFEKFGVKYPTDGMTWDEIINLSKALTREDGGVPYLGIYTGGADRMAMGLNLNYLDLNTNRANLVTEDWKQVLTTFKSAHSLPGYVVDGKFPDLWSIFNNERRVAMAAFWGPDAIQNFNNFEKGGKPINWDMVTLPTFKKGQGFAWQVEAHTLVVTSTSKYKDQAYQVLSVMTSDEVQNNLNKSGVLTTLKKTPEVIKQYGSDLPTMKGKNANALFALKPGARNITKFDDKGRSLINSAANEILIKGTDQNTVLTNAQEQLNKYIDQVTAQ